MSFGCGPVIAAGALLAAVVPQGAMAETAAVYFPPMVWEEPAPAFALASPERFMVRVAAINGDVHRGADCVAAREVLARGGAAFLVDAHTTYVNWVTAPWVEPEIRLSWTTIPYAPLEPVTADGIDIQAMKPGEILAGCSDLDLPEAR